MLLNRLEDVPPVLAVPGVARQAPREEKRFDGFGAEDVPRVVDGWFAGEVCGKDIYTSRRYEMNSAPLTLHL